MTIQELEQCILLYGKDIYSFCMHLAKEKESADDLYQDAFLEATKKIASIRYEDNPKSYLLSIVIRLWKNRVRKRAWRSRIAPQVAEEAIEESTAVSGSDMVERVVKEEEKVHLWKAVDALSDVYRIPLLLYYMENQNVASIAKLLSIPQGTVKSLNASIVKKAKETQNMKHRTLKSGVAAAAAIGILVVGSASAYAAYRYLTPSQVADQMTEDGTPMPGQMDDSYQTFCVSVLIHGKSFMDVNNGTLGAGAQAFVQDGAKLIEGETKTVTPDEDGTFTYQAYRPAKAQLK